MQKHPKTLPFSYFYQRTICQQACFFKRSLFDSVFYFNEAYKIVSDWEFLIYAIYIKRIQYKKIDQTIAVYDMQGISSSSEFRAQSNKEREQVLETYFAPYKDDYKRLMSFGSPRFNQLQTIESSVFLRRIVSVFFKCILVFVPSKK